MPQDLSQMSTEELLRMRNGAQQAPAPAPARAPGVIQGRPKPIEAPAPPAPPRETETWRTLSPAEAKQQGLPEGGVYQVNGAGSVKTIQAPAKARDGGSISVAAAQNATENISQFTALTRSLGTFKDDFAGNRAGNWAGELENQAEARFGVGTPGQSEWWADFRATDNLIRNSLFGASLTQGEKTAYEQTTIAPGMSPEKVRANLQRRTEIVRNALERQKEFYLANGYKPEAVEALFAPLAPIAEGGAQGAGGGEDNEYQARLISAYQSGATYEELDAIAKEYGLALTNVASQEDLDRKRAAGVGFTFGGGDAPPPSDGGEDPLASRTFGEFGRFMNAFGQVTGDAATLGFGDELSGVGGAIGAALRGEDISEGYETARNRDLARSAAAEEYMGGATVPLQLLTGGAGGRAVSGVQAALGTARSLAASGAPVTRQAIQRGLTGRAAGSGAVIGGTAGAGQGETLQQRGTNALAGVVAGGVLGGGGQAVGNALANRAAPAVAPASAAAGVQQAADNLGIEVIPAVTGGTSTRMLTSGAKQGFISAQPINKSIDRMTDQAMAARDGIADSVGARLDDETAGNVIRSAGEVFSQRTSRIGGKLYDRVERLGGGQKFPLTGAVTKADEWLADVGRSVQGKDGKIYREIEKLRNSMASGEFDVMSIPRTRDEFRAILQESNLRGTTLETAVKQILKEGEDDILRGLQASGNDRAVGAFKTASEFWQKRVDTIDNFFDPILGRNAPKSGEQVVTALERLADPKTGNSAQLVGIMKAMPPREAASVRATLINRMGRATGGSAKNRDEATFSFDTFATNWNNMSTRAKAAIFPPEARGAMDDLAKVAFAVKEAGSSANRSNTAGALVSQGAISSAIGWFIDPLTAVGMAGGQYAVGRLLASPKFARTLARAPRQDTPQARQALSARLGNLAQAEPTLAREIGLYQRALAANDNGAASLAAEDENNNPR